MLTPFFEEQERTARDAMTANQLHDDDNTHKKSHAGGLKHRRPVAPSDNKNRSRGLLHRRMNIASNVLAATLLRVPFDAKKRIAANKLMDPKMIWKMPETKNKRAKTISAGNDARILFSDPDLPGGLLAIFFEDDVEGARALLKRLSAAAAANVNVRAETPAAPPPAARANGKAPARANPIPLQPAGVSKGKGQGQGQGKGKGKGKKAVKAVLTVGSKKVTAEDARAYAKRRAGEAKKAAAATPLTPAATAPSTTAAEGFRAAVESAGAPESDNVVEDESLCPDDDDEAEMMEEPEEDQTAGDLATAIEVWLTAIQYTSDLHSTLADHFDLHARKAHADKCAASGKAWALAINEHTSNRALWQYVHDAFAHVAEDIMEHGSGDRNDDAILEKGNRRFKRIGDRCVMRGGRNGGTWTRKVRVAEKIDGKKTGKFTQRTITVKAVEGQAAQTQRLELIAQTCEATRLAQSQIMSAKAVETIAEVKVLREINRNQLVANLEDSKKACANMS